MKRFLLIFVISISSLAAKDVNAKVGDSSIVIEKSKLVASKNPKNIIVNNNVQRYNTDCFIKRNSKITILAEQDDTYLVEYSALEDSNGYGSICFNGTLFFMKKKDWIPLALAENEIKMKKEKESLELLKEIKRLEIDKKINSIALSIIKDFKKGKIILYRSLNISNQEWELFSEVENIGIEDGYHNTYFVRPFSSESKYENFDNKNREYFIIINEHYSIYEIAKYTLKNKK